jgi:hypothetical protein
MDPVDNASVLTAHPSNGRMQFTVAEKADPLSDPNFKIKQPNQIDLLKNQIISTDSKESSDSNETHEEVKDDLTTNTLATNNNNNEKLEGTDWIIAISVVSFDIDEGQVIEYITPPNALSRGEQKLLSLLSFPDSNSFNAEGSVKYIFRLKRDSIDKEYDYGYTYFKQRKDATNLRGYFQKSLVILTSLPYIHFYKSLVEIVGNAYFSQDPKYSNFQFIDSIYDTICKWPPLNSGSSYELKIMNEVLLISIPREANNKKRIHGKFGIEIKIPNKKNPLELSRNPSNGNGSGSESSPTTNPENNAPDLQYILNDLGIQERGLFQDINLFNVFKFDKLHLLWKLWELVITNQPLLVISDSPSECSETVFGLISLISPLEFNGDYKPYFTIYDPAYKVYQEQYERKVINNAILGVTNPLFLKSFKNFPNILHLEKDYEIANAKQKPVNYLVSTGKFYTVADKNLPQTMLKQTSQETSAINNSIIRKAFRSFTEAFLNKFDEYFIMQGNDIKKFDEKSFIKFIEGKKFNFQQYFISHSKIIKLYMKFIQSANFIPFMKKFENVYFVKSIKT